MDEKLYSLMNWPQIEAVVYSECDNPLDLLGPHITKDGVLIQTFQPAAVSVSLELVSAKKVVSMERVDGAGFFAVLLPRKTVPDYRFHVAHENGSIKILADPYRFSGIFKEQDLKRFADGIHYEIYEKLGAHPMTLQNTEGVHFAVWAPNAVRVSVVGDFNVWDGRCHPMQRLGDFGIFELFIPELEEGMIYKYELKFKNGDPALKADPYGSYSQLRPDTASVIWDRNKFKWSDEEWLEKRAKASHSKRPISIYEVHLGSWMQHELPEPAGEEEEKANNGKQFLNYRELAPKLIEYVKEMGYTHIELMPVMEHPLDASWGYQVTGYYAPTSRYGTPDDFMFFMDLMHANEIGVILDWVPAHFPRDAFGLADFDGTCLYEHKDPRQGAHPHWGTLIYNYGRPQVSNFLIANALYWVAKYHADGIRMDAVASMLYLDYGKNDGEWIPNIFGGHENLEAVEFLKHLNSIFKKRKDGALLIAEESTAWPQVTGAVDENGLGFDYKWNMGWMNDFLSYMKNDPMYRSQHYGELTFSLIYAYSEKFVLVFSHDEVVHGKGSMIQKMPGDTTLVKAANLRAAYGFMMAHPGKKLIFMGQDFGQIKEWNENISLSWELLEHPVHSQLKQYVKALNQIYTTYPALYELDHDLDGFEWINCISSNENTVSFLRKTKKKGDTLLIICNFAPVLHDKFQIGVPYKGKYKEILNSDAKEFGGQGLVNARMRQSKAEEWDERKNSITIRLAPFAAAIFQYSPLVEKVSGNKAAKAKENGRGGKTKKMVDDIKKAMLTE